MPAHHGPGARMSCAVRQKRKREEKPLDATQDELIEDLNRFIRATVKFGRREIIPYGDWLYNLSDEDFKTVGDLIFRTARGARRTGDWGPLPGLGYWCREFQAEYRTVRDQRRRRPRPKDGGPVDSPELYEAIDRFAKEQTITGDDAVREYVAWLEELTPDDFKAVGNIIFGVSKQARKTGDWGRLPYLRYCDWSFRKTYRFIQLRLPRR